MNKPRPFRPADQEPVRALILEGMKERWAEKYEPDRDHDVDDIWRHYVKGRGADVRVIGAGNEVIAVGMLVLIDDRTGRLVRISVDRRHRRKGFATTMIRELMDLARERGMAKVVIETDTPWADALALYLSCGFERVAEGDGSTHFERQVMT